MTSTRRPTILLIDDNAIQAATRQTILKRADYFVIAVLSPQRALDQFRSADFSEDIELVITDHIMPGMNGDEFVKILRETHPDLPVLVISGLEEAESAYSGLDVTFRLKPLLPDHLLATVHSLIQKKRQSSPDEAGIPEPPPEEIGIPNPSADTSADPGPGPSPDEA